MITRIKSSSQRAFASARESIQPEVLSQYRLLRPLAHRFHDPVYWSMSARPMAIGISCGLLWAFWIPFGQILISCLFALWFRGNLAAAAVATFLSNPLTFAPLAYIAHHLGSAILGPAAVASFTFSLPPQLAEFTFLTAAQEQISALGIPWLVGMIALGPISALAGLLLTPLVMAFLARR